MKVFLFLTHTIINSILQLNLIRAANKLNSIKLILLFHNIKEPYSLMKKSKYLFLLTHLFKVILSKSLIYS